MVIIIMIIFFKEQALYYCTIIFKCLLLLCVLIRCNKCSTACIDALADANHRQIGQRQEEDLRECYGGTPQTIAQAR